MNEIAHVLSIPALVAAVNSALDHKVFYQDDFNTACGPAWEATIPVVEQRLPDVVLEPTMSHTERHGKGLALRDSVLRGPRGTWALLRTRKLEGGEYFNALIHDGAGRVHARSDGWATTPTFAQIRDRMISMEIYLARREVEQRRATSAAVARIAELGLEPGKPVKHVLVGHKKFSSGVVVSINPLTGSVTLCLIKRGSRRRFRAQLLATQIVFEHQFPVARKVPDASAFALVAA